MVMCIGTAPQMPILSKEKACNCAASNSPHKSRRAVVLQDAAASRQTKDVQPDTLPPHRVFQLAKGRDSRV